MRRSRRRRQKSASLPVVAGSLLGLAVGAACGVYLPGSSLLASAVKVGAWQTDLTTGSEAAGLYTRARTALIGLLALRPDETIYLVAREDDSGAPLRGECRYRLSGSDLPARWWSITVYGSDYFLLSNADRRYSFNATSVPRTPDGRIEFRLGDGEDDLPLPVAGPFVLALRLYNPEPAIAAAPTGLRPPAIERIGSCP